MKSFLKYSSLLAAFQMGAGSVLAALGTHPTVLTEPSLGFLAFVASYLLLLVASDYRPAELAYERDLRRQVHSHLRKAPHALAA